ncbi:MAG: hypothetical protein QOD44_3186 [Solirubrobacteraceae bacterium]|jgi:hypothetical protein|nr:hypothetical protein [Solirubrobacteraceae bacterium]
MDDCRAQRTLVKSPPELWAEISDAGALGGHLEAFGEIRITRLVPETTVAWEGGRARGTVELEPAGWGTRVTLTAHVAQEGGTAGEPVSAPEPEPTAAGTSDDEAAQTGPAPRRWRFLGFLRGRRSDAGPHELSPPPSGDTADPGPRPPMDVQPAECPSTMPAPVTVGRAEEILTGVLDDLGAARHRPFSRG